MAADPTPAPAPARPRFISACTVFMSLRYLRYRFVNIISVVCVALSVAILIVVLGVMSGFQTKIREAFQETTSDLVCFKQIRFGDWTAVEKKILEQPHVVGCAPRVKCVAAMSVPGDPIGYWLEIFGVDPAKEATVTKFRKHLEQVRYQSLKVADPNDPFRKVELGADERPRPPILLGETVFQGLQISKGQTIAIAAARIESDPSKPVEKRFQPRELVCATAGAFTTGSYEYDQHTAYLPLQVVLDDFLDVDNTYLEIYVKLDDYEKNGPAAIASLEKALSPFVRVKSWEDLNATMLGAVEIEKHMLAVILSLLFVLAGGSILAILTMMVVEKTRDIGILKSIGCTVRGIASIFVLNALSIGVVGSAIGLVLGLLVTFNVNWIDVHMLSPIIGHRIFRENIYVFKDIPVRIEAPVIGTIVAAAIAVSLLAGLIPAWKAARMNAVESLRYE